MAPRLAAWLAAIAERWIAHHPAVWRTLYAAAAMDLFLAICQALGVGLACGIGGPLAALFVVVMANLGAGIDPAKTEWDFLASDWFAAAVFAANVAAFYGARREIEMRIPLAAVAAVIGAIAGAASLAERGEPALVGLTLGALAGAFASLLAQSVLAGARRRAAAGGGAGERPPGDALVLILAAAGLALAALALFAPPSSLVGLGALLVLAAGRRRRAGEKYEGLRILR